LALRNPEGITLCDYGEGRGERARLLSPRRERDTISFAITTDALVKGSQTEGVVST